MEFVIPDKRKTEVTIYGQKYFVTKPTVQMVEAMGDMNGLSDLQKVSVAKDMVSKLGIPKDVLDGLEIEHFSMLMEYLTSGTVKKS